MKNIGILLLLVGNYLGSLNAQNIAIRENPKGKVSLSSFFKSDIQDGGGNIFGIGTGYALSNKWELNAIGGSVWSKHFEKVKSEGYFWGISTEYYVLNSFKKTLNLSFKAAYERNNAAITPFKLTFSSNIYKKLISRNNNQILLLRFSPSFIKAKELLNNRFAIEGGLLLNLYIDNQVYSIQPFVNRIFGLCCGQGNTFGISVSLFLR